MNRWYLPLTAAIGIALFGWHVNRVGPRELRMQLQPLKPALAFILVIAGVRFCLQAAGWRMAMPSGQRPSWREAFAAVVAGEAAGYFAWGTVSREPTKAMLVA